MWDSFEVLFWMYSCVLGWFQCSSCTVQQSLQSWFTSRCWTKHFNIHFFSNLTRKRSQTSPCCCKWVSNICRNKNNTFVIVRLYLPLLYPGPLWSKLWETSAVMLEHILFTGRSAAEHPFSLGWLGVCRKRCKLLGVEKRLVCCRVGITWWLSGD